MCTRWSTNWAGNRATTEGTRGSRISSGRTWRAHINALSSCTRKHYDFSILNSQESGNLQFQTTNLAVNRPWYVENDPAAHNEQMLPPAAIKICQKKLICNHQRFSLQHRFVFLYFFVFIPRQKNKRLRSSDVRHRLTPEPLKYDPALHSLHTSIEEAPEIQT